MPSAADPVRGPRTDSPEMRPSPRSPTEEPDDAEREMQEKGRAALRARLFAPRYVMPAVFGICGNAESTYASP